MLKNMIKSSILIVVCLMTAKTFPDANTFITSVEGPPFSELFIINAIDSLQSPPPGGEADFRAVLIQFTGKKTKHEISKPIPLTQEGTSNWLIVTDTNSNKVTSLRADNLHEMLKKNNIIKNSTLIIKETGEITFRPN